MGSESTCVYARRTLYIYVMFVEQVCSDLSLGKYYIVVHLAARRKNG